jgi:HK97 family phage portal protein
MFLTQMIMGPADSRTVENPNVPITDPKIWRHYFGTTEGDSGIRLTADRLLEYSPIWAGVRCIACDIAQMPLVVYRREGKGKEEAKNHSAYRLLRRQANQDMTSNIWKQVVVTHALVYGRSYSWIIRNNGAQPLELLPLHPEGVSTARNAKGELFYTVQLTPKEGRQRQPPKIVPARDMFVIVGMTLDGLGGLSLIQYSRNSVGRGLAAEKHSNRFFRNNANPGGILVHPHRLDDKAINNLRESFSQLHAGLDNAYRFAILEEGMEWKQTGVSPEDSQLIQSLQFGVKDAARVLGIPPHRLGDETKSSFASLEQENLSYQESTLGPWYDKIQEEAFAKLLSYRERDRNTHTVEFKRNKILQADAATRHSVYAVGLQNGFYNRDEVRAWENMNPLPDNTGQSYFIPLNMTTTDDIDEGQQEEEPQQSTEENVNRLRILESQQRLLAREFEREGKRLRQIFLRARKSGETFCTAIDDIAQHIDHLEKGLIPTVEAVHATDCICPSAKELAARYIDMWRRAMDGVARAASETDLYERAGSVIEQLVTSGTTALSRTITLSKENSNGSPKRTTSNLV